jgi:hypothetical protein
VFDTELCDKVCTSREDVWKIGQEFLIASLWWFMVFNATFNNISVISWWSALLVEETGVPGENH